MADQRNRSNQCAATTASGSQCKRHTAEEFCATHAQEPTRSPRESDSRKSESRPTDSYVPASQLPAPDKRDGWEHRYVRTAQLGSADNRNVSKRFREGWEPINLADYPELKGEMTDVGSQYPDSLEIGGLLLCRMPSEQVEARNKYQDNLAQQQMDSVDTGFMNEQDPRMPKYNDSKSRTSFRKG